MHDPERPRAARRAGTSLPRRRVLQGGAAAALAPVLLPYAARATDRSVPRPLDLRVVMSGHSLTDPIEPMLEAIVAAAGAGRQAVHRVERSTIPGSPMDWRWDNRIDDMPDARTDIADYDVLVLTERVPLSNTLPWHDSDEMALRWVRHAWDNGAGGAGAETILYATWVNIDSGPEADNPHKDPERHIPFRERLPLEMARWEKIRAHVDANRPDGAPAMRVIPGTLIIAAAHDAIAAGVAPGLSDIADLFKDRIHLNDAGAYLISLAHYAVIYGRDPRELPARIGKRGQPEPEQSAWMRDLVWDVLNGYPAAGLTAL